LILKVRGLPVSVAFCSNFCLLGKKVPEEASKARLVT
jgi:hypothetical protein